MAAIDLTKKGSRLAIAKDGELNKVKIGLSWDVQPQHQNNNKKFDLDLWVIYLNENQQLLDNNIQNVLFYNNEAKTTPCGSAKHSGDNRTGEGDGDDEFITIELPKVPESCKYIAVLASIYEDEENPQNQTFGMVNNAAMNLYNDETGEKIAVLDLTEDFSTETALVFGLLYKHTDNTWKFNTISGGFQNIHLLLQNYNIG